MSRTGITSAPFLRGRSGSSNIKAWRGKTGWKEAQALKLKMKPKKKVSKKNIDRLAKIASPSILKGRMKDGFTLPKASARKKITNAAGGPLKAGEVFKHLYANQAKNVATAGAVGATGVSSYKITKKALTKKKKISRKATGGFISVSDYVEDII